ncbi:MAG TPA: lysylphosphatidylglycerol synthase domain-containing protein, partial [Polyangiaceae bacterium]|nr:lysylphosphatidylglycerol synthase domain-containing protein [Polyangiaceae bacterium]
ALLLILRGFEVNVDPALAVFFYATATLAGAIVPVPGGLGVAEAMIQEQLIRLGRVPQAPATSAMILIRFATLWWAVIVGFIALALLRRRFPKLLREGADEEID